MSNTYGFEEELRLERQHTRHHAAEAEDRDRNLEEKLKIADIHFKAERADRANAQKGYAEELDRLRQRAEIAEKRYTAVQTRADQAQAKCYYLTVDLDTCRAALKESQDQSVSFINDLAEVTEKYRLVQENHEDCADNLDATCDALAKMTETCWDAQERYENGVAGTLRRLHLIQTLTQENVALRKRLGEFKQGELFTGDRWEE